MAVRLTISPPAGGEATRLDFDQERIRVGRGAMCDVRLPHAAVSAVHAMIMMDRDRYYAVDLGSTNGTAVNGDPLVVDRRKLLRSGDVIEVAGFSLEFRAGVAMLSPHSQDRTLAAARQLAQHLMRASGEALRPPTLLVLAGPQEGERFELPPPPATVVVGRSDECDIVLVDSEASRKNVELEIASDGVSFRDLGGKNPVRVAERDVRRSRIRDRDELQIGSTVLVFDEPVDAFLREMADRPEADTKEATPAPPVQTGDLPPAPEADTSSVVDSEPIAAAPAGPSQEESLPELAEGEPASPSASTPPSDRMREKAPRGAGSEMAVLFVGALALAACVAALVWLFR